MSLKDHITDIVKRIFPKLNEVDLSYMQEYTYMLLDYMLNKYGFNDSVTINQFKTLLTQNNNQHIYSTIRLLLPYIDDQNDFALFKTIKNLSDITVRKKHGVAPDINPYDVCTYQYSRYYDLNKENINDKIHAKYEHEHTQHKHANYYEYVYSVDDLIQNYHILCETIELTRTKLMVNWLDIVPITREDYKQSRLYLNSPQFVDGTMMIDGVRMEQWKLDPDDSMFYYSGITCYDMFNAVHVYLFKEIYDSGVKWLMYEKQITKNSVPITYLQVLDRIVNIKYLSQTYGTLTTSIKESIREQWTRLKSQSNSIQKNMLKCIIFKFDNLFCTSEIEETYGYDSRSFYKAYRRVNFNDEDQFLNLDDIKIDSVEFTAKMQDFFTKIPYEVIHDFLYSQIERFNRTWYGKQIIKDGNIDTIVKLNNDLEKSYKGKNNEYYLTYKNIYNYAKYISLEVLGTNSHISDARGLSEHQWTTFFNILNGDHGKRFRLPNVIVKTYGEDSRSDITGFQDFIDRNFKQTFVDNVFLVFISIGLLTHIVPDPNMTNKSLLGHNDDSRKTELKERFKRKYIDNTINNNRYLNTEYYLTREPFRNLELYNKSGDKMIDWFTHLYNGAPWFNFFALSLISQINFYHHFLNNRVIMVTGSTGQGKSVVVPLLFYHANVALTLNSMTKVLSTQALVAATTGNSKFMATNLGVPIDVNGFETNSSYVQYSTQNDKHDVKHSETFIKEVTDRTLLEQLLSNPILKKPKTIKNNKITEYRDDNLYDVIIIDEAHMHNTSMDLILSIIRNAILINNQLRLVITSATMDADEFIYRRFYKYINDNFIYPISSHIDPVLNEPLDKSVVDRRFHISPPGETNQYTVTDIYLDQDVESYEDAERLGILKVKEIMDNTTGDILFFTTTTKNVIKLTKEINSFTPNNTIALPLYSTMRDREKDIKWFDNIKDINKTLHTITVSKDEICEVIDTGSNEWTKVKPGTYTRAIIIATNVVEASVTIDSLRYVIETGYSFNVMYNADTGLSSMGIEPIADASRLQRRGRVGRVAAGTVYYMYREGARAHIKPEYELVTKDITFDIFKILASNAELMADLKYHPQNYKYTKSNQSDYNAFLEREPNEIIRNIYTKQYKHDIIEPEHDHPLIPISTSLAKDHDKVFGRLYSDGYGMTDMFDPYGKFFVIHPGEKQIVRNVINGDIDVIRTKSIIEGSDSNYMTKVYNSMIKVQALKYIYYDKHYDNHEYENDQYVHKFEYINDINAIIQNETESIESLTKNLSADAIIRLLKTMYLANKFNCTNDVLKILALSHTIESYQTFILKQDDKPYPMTNEFIHMWKHPTSELLSYLNIMNRFVTEDNSQYDYDFKNNKINERYTKFEDFYREKGNQIFANTKLIDQSEFSREEVKYFMEAKNRRYRDEERIDRYKSMAKTIRRKNDSFMANTKSSYIEFDVMNNAIKLYEKLLQLNAKPKIQASMNRFANYYIINNTEFPLLICFLDSYTINLSYIKDIVKNIITGIAYNKPKISLLLDQTEFCFYLHGTDDLIGLTSIDPNTISKHFNITAFRSLTDESKLLEQYMKPEYITSQANIVNEENKEYDMNDIIIADLKLLS